MLATSTDPSDGFYTKAEKTGNYFNPVTQHRAWFSQGADVPPGYALDTEDPGGADIDDDRLRRAVEIETREIDRKREEAEERAAEEAEKAEAAETAKAEIERTKDEELEQLRARIAELEAKSVDDGDETDGAEQGDARGSQAQTPRARRRQQQG